MSRSPHLLWPALAAALLLVGCGERTHVIGEGLAADAKAPPDSRTPDPSGDARADDAGSPAGALDAGVPEVGPSDGPGMAGPGAMPPAAPGQRLLRRLTIREYSNTLRDLIGTPPPASLLSQLASDAWTDASGSTQGSHVASADDVMLFMTIAEQMARTAVQNLSTLLPASCLPLSTKTTDLDQCARTFIQTFGARAYREPLTDQAAGALFRVYLNRRGVLFDGPFADSIRVVITAMLQSHNFLHRWELAAPPRHDITSTAQLDKFVPFGPYEMASRLSYFFWGSMPDSQLFAAAAANQLSTPDQLAAQARRLLADPRAADAIGDFHRQWLDLEDVAGLEKDLMLFPTYSSEIAQLLENETGDFAAHVLLGPAADGRLSTLLTSSQSVIDARLATYYGIPAVTATAPTLVTLNPLQRSGILTHGAFLANTSDEDASNPVRRGLGVLNHLLCQNPEEPAGIVIPPLPERQPNQTNREVFQAGTSDPICRDCHAPINGLGFAFENYDATGAYRTMDGTRPVDATGTVTVSGGSLTFTNAVDLVKQLAPLPAVRSCLATYWLQWLLRRSPALPEATWLSDPINAFSSSGGDIRELLIALTRTPDFSLRARVTEEVEP